MAKTKEGSGTLEEGDRLSNYREQLNTLSRGK
jgi:hypothetical protein